jgi:hypothetical protein
LGFTRTVQPNLLLLNTEKFKNEFSVYEGGKGSVQFPFDKPIPYGLISKIVKFKGKRKHGKSRGKREEKIDSSARCYALCSRCSSIPSPTFDSPNGAVERQPT